MQPALIIFIKNPVIAKVKTRLGRVIGDAEALQIYLELCRLTRQIVSEFSGKKYLFYSDEIIPDDDWNPVQFNKQKQQGLDLGERMANAFQLVFEQHKRIILIGSDCPYLQNSHLLEAIHELKKVDCVIGPSEDGGYYLLGLKTLIPELFIDKSWSCPTLLKESLSTLKELNYSAQLLEMLEDIDNQSDWERYQNSKKMRRND